MQCRYVCKQKGDETRKKKINDVELFDLALISQSETTRNVLQIVLRINILGMEKYKIKVVSKPNKMLLFFILGGGLTVNSK